MNVKVIKTEIVMEDINAYCNMCGDLLNIKVERDTTNDGVALDVAPCNSCTAEDILWGRAIEIGRVAGVETEEAMEALRECKEDV